MNHLVKTVQFVVITVMDEILIVSKMDRKNYSSLSPNLLTNCQNAQIKKVKSDMIIRVTLI